jgi:hypothetical protein
MAVGFHHMGSNPSHVLEPSSAYVTWPSTYGTSVSPYWYFCSIGDTTEYQVFANLRNFPRNRGNGVRLDLRRCFEVKIAALNANPWRKDDKKHHHGHDHEDDWSSEGEHDD